MNPNLGQARKGKRGKAYPGIDLKHAVELCRVLANVSKPVTKSDLYDLWQRKENTVTKRYVAALIAYGLCDVVESRHGCPRLFRLSDTGLAVVTHSSPEHLQAAALKPPLFRQLWQKYQDGVPTKEQVAEFLAQESPKTQLKMFYRQYTQTMNYAHPTARAVAEEPESAVQFDMLLDAGLATLKFPRRMSRDDYELLIKAVGAQLWMYRRVITGGDVDMETAWNEWRKH